MSADTKLTELGITLPAPTTPRANFVTSVQTGNMPDLAGHGPLRDGSSHNPKEAMAMGDFAEAARLLYGMLDELVG